MYKKTQISVILTKKSFLRRILEGFMPVSRRRKIPLGKNSPAQDHGAEKRDAPKE